MSNATTYRVHISSRFGDFTQDITKEPVGFYVSNMRKEADAIAKCVMGTVTKIEKIK